MTDAFLQILLENLNSLVRKELGFLWGVDEQLQKLSSTLTTIQAVIQGAEEKQLRDKAIQNWLKKLKDVAYAADDILDECAADDILDECAVEASRVKFQHQRSRSIINKVNKTCLSTCFHPGHVAFLHKIGRRLKYITERIDEIAAERVKFHLHETVADRPIRFSEARQTMSAITQPQIYGREEDKEKAVECLVKHVSNCNGVSVYPVVGMGGVGKTTLAQLVFNDERVCGHFELRIWVCVSEDFDVKRVIKAIIESASQKASEDLDLEPLQRHLQDVLKGKRYLLVLDDVWNEDPEKWDKLKSVMQCGSRGASVMVTTRLLKVASIVGTLPLHCLSGLSQDDCLLLFKQRAFGNNIEERPNLVAIGKDIVKKCGGVPLAAKALGSLMRFKSDEKEWLHVKESELWNLPQDENSILPALRLSYSNLPLELRQCFAFCAIFPKDYEISKEELILLWMACGFISSDAGLDVEDIGNIIWNELHWRSFFEDVKKDWYGNILSFKMHDLVHDLAQSVVGDEYRIIGDKWPNDLSSRVSHVNILYAGWIKSIPENFYGYQSVRTILQTTNVYSICNKREAMLAVSGLSKLHSMRVFDARAFGITKLTSLVGSLKHLRYLDISYNRSIKVLPDSICSLWNLQTLKLEGCVSLQKLPRKMKRLRNLRHLHINGCKSLDHMPPDMGQMTCLRTLTFFIVGSKRKGCGLSELQGLNLRGDFTIKHLERVQSLGEAKEANLIEKQNLQHLSLSWAVGDESELLSGNVKLVLEGLEPHPGLKSLSVEGYKGIDFPPWINYPALENIVSISLKDCKNCSHLPPFWSLPSLEELTIEGMDALEYIHEGDHGFHGGFVSRVGFACLIVLRIWECPNLKGLSVSEGREMFPYLDNIYIIGCPKLTLPCLPSLTCLELRHCNELLLGSVSNLYSLTSLSIYWNDSVASFPGVLLQNSSVLRSLEIRSLTKLQVWIKNPISLNALQSLDISNCPELESFSGLQGLNSLRSLNISHCKKFKYLPDGFQHLPSLESLTIEACPELVFLPYSIRYLSSLQRVMMCGTYHDELGESIAAKLEVLPEALQHVPALRWLSIRHYPRLESLPNWLGKLPSLQSLSVSHCPKLTSLPRSIQNLTNLQKLSIVRCPELQRQCERERGDGRSKIDHVPEVCMC